MNEDEAKTMAERFIATQDMKGHSIQFVSATKGIRSPDEWSILYDLFSPQGTLIDGPIVVLVDDASGEVRLFGLA